MFRLSLLTTIVVLLALVPGVASASVQAIYDDCQDNGRLDKQYSNSDYRKALKEVPEDFDEYTNCSDLIRGAMAGVKTSGGSDNADNGGGGGSNPNGGGGSTGGGSSGNAGPSDVPTGNGAGSVPVGPDGKPLNPLIDAQEDERAQVTSAVSGEQIRPTAAGVRPGEADGELPTPLIVLLALVAVAGLAAGALGVKQLLFSGPRTA
jgi:hypothetical protein